jgi:hypothetical protein
MSAGTFVTGNMDYPPPPSSPPSNRAIDGGVQLEWFQELVLS